MKHMHVATYVIRGDNNPKVGHVSLHRLHRFTLKTFEEAGLSKLQVYVTELVMVHFDFQEIQNTLQILSILVIYEIILSSNKITTEGAK